LESFRSLIETDRINPLWGFVFSDTAWKFPDWLKLL